MTLERSFLKRSVTVIFGLPLVIAIVYIGGVPMLITCAVFALVGLREFYIAFSKRDMLIHLIGYLATAGYFAAIYIFGAGYWLLIALTSFIITVQTCLVVFFRKLPIRECITTVYGFLYVPFLLSFVVLVREHSHELGLGFYYVWLIFIASFGCDTFAYFTGSLFGKNKLAKSPSPSKSVEGLVGGIIGATIIGLVYGFFVSRFASHQEAIELLIINAAIISFIGAFFSIIGDMTASAVKRHCEIKDFGNVFPGHGGVLDRVDSILLVAPTVYMVMNVLIWLGAY
ncbi:MAG: phosphatidate cytidylyltransferase [Defluviitaleaceae bacterium]|nr:phosphatidate cytidylyltransferase [Defluviitaleaceae bacterium]